MANNKKNKDDSISIKKDTVWKIISAILLIVIIVLIVKPNSDMNYKEKEQVEMENNRVPKKDDQPNEIDMEVLIDDDYIKGDKDAPITIIEFSDYECPFCARFYSQTYKKIEEEYINTGKVKLVYRDFPLGFHKQAQKAAEAAQCAGDQGKYYDMHDILFEKGVSGGVSTFKEYAEEIGLNQNEFDTCLDSNKYEAEVKKDMQDGTKLGITGTPAFIINGKAIVGAQPFDVFKQIIDAELGMN